MSIALFHTTVHSKRFTTLATLTHQEQRGVQYFAQGHFNMQLSPELGFEPSDLLITSQLALPRELQQFTKCTILLITESVRTISSH